MPHAHYDVIVVGTGGVGSAALYHLARRGVRVIGLDRFSPGHDRGSSHGQTRMFRTAYYEHPAYVPLLLRALDLWKELEHTAEKPLFHEVGVLHAGPTEGDLISGVLRSAYTHNLSVEVLSTQDTANRWPGYRLPGDFVSVFEPRAGFLLVEECVKSHIAAAERAGATLWSDCEVRRWSIQGGTAIVETDSGFLSADRLVVTAGAWTRDLLGTLNVDLQVLRKSLFWYMPRNDTHHPVFGYPCFLFESLDGLFYGFPQYDTLGVKLAEHTGGHVVNDPLQVDRTVDHEERERVERFIMAHLPHLSCKRTSHSVCLYTMSRDGHFIIGAHPEFPQVVFVAGLSGHGFKAASVLGEIAAQLAVDGTSEFQIYFLSPRRFA